MDNAVLALKVSDLDNVATIFSDDGRAGTTVQVRDKAGDSEALTLLDDVPYGHKVALHDIRIGEHIMKYGEVIGVASTDIPKGAYVHVHNLDSTRGRGDLEEEHHA